MDGLLVYIDRKVGEFIDLRLIEVYGDPGPAIRRLLGEKAQLLGRDARVVVRDRTVGFARIGARLEVDATT